MKICRSSSGRKSGIYIYTFFCEKNIWHVFLFFLFSLAIVDDEGVKTTFEVEDAEYMSNTLSNISEIIEDIVFVWMKLVVFKWKTIYLNDMFKKPYFLQFFQVNVAPSKDDSCKSNSSFKIIRYNLNLFVFILKPTAFTYYSMHQQIKSVPCANIFANESVPKGLRELVGGFFRKQNTFLSPQLISQNLSQKMICADQLRNKWDLPWS